MLRDDENQSDADESSEKPKTNPLRFKAAEESLAWVFGSMASAIGFGAQNIENGGGGLVWDAARIAALHMKMRAPARLKAAEQIRRLEWATAELAREDFEVAHLAFTPRGLSPQMRYAFRKGDGKRCLAVVAAVKCPFAVELRDRRREEARARALEVAREVAARAARLDPEDRSSVAKALRAESAQAARLADAPRNESVFEFLEWECASLNEDGKRVPPRLAKIRDWADELVDGVIDRFVPILDERDAFDYKIRAAKKEQLEKRNAEIMALFQPKRPQTVEERIRAVDEIVERMVHGGGPRR
jgi:hypothetical protein